MYGFQAYKKDLWKFLKTNLLVDLYFVFFSNQSVSQSERLFC